MSEVFFYKMVINETSFDRMMREEDLKNHFKQQLSHELAKMLIETNRVKFTYTKNPLSYDTVIKAEITL